MQKFKTTILNSKQKLFFYVFPLIFILSYFLLKSLAFPLHDFSNSYFAASLANENLEIQEVLYDVYSFNKYAWSLGYPEVLMDFYVNTPFTITAFYPFTIIKDAYIAKTLFNILSILLFLVSIFKFLKTEKDTQKKYYFLLMLPFLFFVPFRNQILFGQTYFLVFALVVFSYFTIEKQKKIAGIAFLSTAALLKVFPLFYGVIYLFNKKFKTLLVGILFAFFCILISIFFNGLDVWLEYLFKIIPNVVANKSAINFQYNAQSAEVFLKTIFIKDAYYNPNVLLDSKTLYLIFKWLFKSFVLAIAIQCSFNNKKNTFALLSIWVVTLFLIQSRTATYAQIFWILPAFYFFTNKKITTRKKTLFFVTLFLIANFPLTLLKDLPVFFKFSRFWLFIIISYLFFSSFKKVFNFKTVLVLLVLMIPFSFSSLVFKQKIDKSEYVLKEKKYFMILDFSPKNGVINYIALGKKGKEEVQTNIKYTTYNATICRVIDNQIFINGKQITFNTALKKKPILVNNKEVYFLSDYNSRRGVFTLRKITSF